MKIIYIAGPFTALTPWDIAENVRAAERIGLLVARAGAMPLIPHANTAHFHGQLTANFWYEGTMQLLHRSDAAVFIPGWRRSAGSCGEFREAGCLLKPRLQLDDFPEHYFQAEISHFVQWISRGQDDQSEEQREAHQAASNGARKASRDASAGPTSGG